MGSGLGGIHETAMFRLAEHCPVAKENRGPGKSGRGGGDGHRVDAFIGTVTRDGDGESEATAGKRRERERERERAHLSEKTLTDDKANSAARPPSVESDTRDSSFSM